MKCFATPVTIGAMGIVIKGLKKYLETIPAKHSIYILPKKTSCTSDIMHNKGTATI
jgi:hypothetical protein